MKCTIFYLLTFCALATVFADNLRNELANLRRISINRISRTIGTLNAAFEDAKYKTERVDQECVNMCWNYYHKEEFKSSHIQPRINQCNQCHDKAAKNKNIKVAKKCCIDIITEIENQAKLCRAGFKACIAKCVHEARTLKLYADIKY